MHPAALSLLVLSLAAVTVLGDRYHPERGGHPASPYSRIAEDELHAEHWYKEAQAGIKERTARGARGEGRARRLVMFLGDGMSVPTLTAARILQGQRLNRTGEETQLSFEAFPTVGLSKTYCVNSQIPDSACTATAYLCGVKSNQGTLGVTASVPRHDCAASMTEGVHVSSIAEWALAAGMDAGIVTTTRVTHASPAGAYAKAANRGWENDAEVREAGHDPKDCPDIADQLINQAPGNRFKVILGGGRREFRPSDVRDEEEKRGLRTDGRDLIEEWRADKLQRQLDHAYVWNATELRALASSPPDYLLGLFQSSHLKYNMESDDEDPSLAELTEVAIRVLDRNERGFFLFVEGGRIDHAHHDNFVRLALDETIELSSAVRRATELLPEEDSLIVVTSDHSHVMAFNGYSLRGNDILGPSRDIGDDGVPYMTLSYTNGPGARVHVTGVRPDVTGENIEGLRWQTHAEVPLDSETHGGEDVGVFARGVSHGMFSGLYEQSQIPHLMAHAACIGPGPRAETCESSSGPRLGAPGTTSLTLLTALAVLLRR